MMKQKEKARQIYFLNSRILIISVIVIFLVYFYDSHVKIIQDEDYELILNRFNSYNEVEIDQSLYRSPLCNYDIDQYERLDFKNEIVKNVVSFDQIKLNLAKHKIKIDNGGISLSLKNSLCESNNNVAIIIPYRDEPNNLKVWLNNMHLFLNQQRDINYGIYLIEPAANLTFNRGLLLNIGYNEAMKDDEYAWNCFIFHDVNMLPESLNNIYKCNKNYPLHLAVARDKLNYITSGSQTSYFGGVNALTKEQFQILNGFSNLFFKWGKEDDNLYQRALIRYGKFNKIDGRIGRYYTMLPKQQEINPLGEEMLRDTIMYMRKYGIKEGLNTVKYRVKEIKKLDLYTHILVEYDKDLIINEWNSTIFKDINSTKKFS